MTRAMPFAMPSAVDCTSDCANPLLTACRTGRPGLSVAKGQPL